MTDGKKGNLVNNCCTTFPKLQFRSLEEKKLTALAASRNHCFADVALVIVSWVVKVCNDAKT